MTDKELDQNRAPVLEAIEEYHRKGTRSFSLPGHRFGAGVDDETARVLSRDTFRADVGTAKNAVPEAEQLYAKAVGAERAIFTTCGSSISIHTALTSITGPGRTVLVDRNVHKSVVASLIITGVTPIWLRPSWDSERQIAHPATAGTVRQALEQHPEVSAVIIITPTEYGTGADVRGITRTCHEHGVPLFVDEAWGAHFPFHPDLPTSAARAGADLSVNSVHKAGGGVQQASIMFLNGGHVDPVDVRLRLDLITTTSESALAYGSTDGWRRLMVRDGRRLLDDALRRAARLRERVGAIDGLSVMDASIVGHDGVAEWDPLKLSFDVSALGITGYVAKEWLQSERSIQAQLGDARRVVCSLTYADDDEAVDALGDAIEALASARPSTGDRPAPAVPPLEELNLEQVMSPRDAFFAETEQVADPVGRISAEMVSPYPPGVPAILPGELFTEPVVTYLRAGLGAGMTIPDSSDPTLKTFRVVREGHS